MEELPLIAPAVERSDAARNRERILCAAARLIERHGVDCVSVERIAAEAEVGKGTVFRRFGDRAGLLRTLLSDRGAAFQEELIRGAPPLGPGAPARERLLAFGPAYLAYVAANAAVLAAAEGGSQPNAGPYVAYYTHVRYLISEAAPSLDADYLADALMAPLRADLVAFQLGPRGMPLARVADGWRELAGALCSPPAMPPGQR